MGTKSRESIYGASAERATEARKQADRLACEAWNKRMLGFQGPARPSPALGDAINAGFRYLEVKLSRLQHASDGGARHSAATEDDAGPRIRKVHALQGLFGSPQLSVQAQPIHCARSTSRQRTTPWIAGIGPLSIIRTIALALHIIEP